MVFAPAMSYDTQLSQDFGRVQALIVVFGRIVDVDRLGEIVLDAVREEEKRELTHRLGVLNVYNPVRVSALCPTLDHLKTREQVLYHHVAAGRPLVLTDYTVEF